MSSFSDGGSALLRRAAKSSKQMVLLDLWYIENQSVLFDLEILFATIPVVLFGKGAY
jgi:lipopolysaccharide/colanic/teichoic acid biosynthesis glycosyltransferase